MLRTDTASMSPLSDPAHHVVFQAQRSEVDTVMVGGTVMKRA